MSSTTRTQIEEAVIGTVLVNNPAILDFCAALAAPDFSTSLHRATWAFIERGLFCGMPVNPITLRAPLEDRGFSGAGLHLARCASQALVPAADYFLLSKQLVPQRACRLTRHASAVAMRTRYLRLGMMAA